jgi:phosphatidylserine/phosphatidylglycerophosphate/cardiolipin synthase-like enzyme
LSEVTQSYADAGGARDSQGTRDMLSQTLGMRTLVASLWTFNAQWSIDKLPISKRIDEEKQRYAQQMKDWNANQASKNHANTPLIETGGWLSRLPPSAPPDRSQQLKNAMAQRYREIYIHSKLMIIDDSMFTLGSANLNLRSFAVDSEMNIASDDPYKAKDLRQRVWKQHTNKHFDGGADATDQVVMAETFKNWSQEASTNLDRKEKGLPLSNFVVKFRDERTSLFRLG